jgi:creatinine amidohydrolase
MENYLLNTMTFEEAEEAFSSADFLIIPVGSHEQHGLHLTLDVDTILAEEISMKVIEEAFPEIKILLLPSIPYGISEHHMHFSGTISLKPDTMMKILTDIIESISRHNVKNIIILNGHGGNRDSINIISSELQRKFDLNIFLINTFWEYAIQKLKLNDNITDYYGHACEVETSFIMYLAPNRLRPEKIIKPVIPDKFKYVDNSIPWLKFNTAKYFEENTDTGALGDPTKSSKNFGKKIIEYVVNKIIDNLYWYKINFIRET